MKKLSLIVLAVAAISFASCTGKKADASACCADSTAVVAADTTACCADSTVAADSACCAQKKAEGCCPAESKK